MAHTIYKNSKGEKIPSVTTVLSLINKPALMIWHNKMGLEGINTTNYVSELAKIGSLAHRIIECKNCNIDFSFDENYSDEQLEQAKICTKKYFEWESYQDEFRPIKNELKLVSEKFQYAGTIDCLAQLNGKLTLIDYKTCNAIWDSHRQQVAAYYELLKENRYDVEQVVILRIGRNEEEDYFEYVPVSEKQLKQGFKVFKAALKLYNEKKKFDKLLKSEV